VVWFKTLSRKSPEPFHFGVELMSTQLKVIGTMSGDNDYMPDDFATMTPHQ
jgi:hypothetical protein